MELQADKLMVIRALLELKDEKIMLEIKQLLAQHFSNVETETGNAVSEPMVWTEYDQKMLEKSIAEADNGEGIPHAEVMKEFRKLYSR